MNLSKFKKKFDEIGNELEESIAPITTPLIGILAIALGIAYFFGVELPVASLSLMLISAGLLVLVLNFKLRGFAIPKMPKLRMEQIHGAIMLIIAAAAISISAFLLRGNQGLLALALAGIVFMCGFVLWLGGQKLPIFKNTP